MLNRRSLIQAAMLLGGAWSSSAARAMASTNLWLDTPPAQPFSAQAKASVSVIAELIIPATDTPGAIEAGVPRFIERMVSDWYTQKERGIFFDGLRELDEWCAANHNREFIACTVEQQTSALQEAERKAGGREAAFAANPLLAVSKASDENAPFFTKIKELTVLGYYTSEVGATQELRYQPAFATFDGAYPFAKTGRQWST